MTLEWIRFGLTAALSVSGLAVIVVSVLGTYRFRFALNRIHSAAMTDTLGLALLVAGMLVAEGATLAALKMLLVVGFMWVTSPISSHMLVKLEVVTDRELRDHCAVPEDPNGKDVTQL